ncbi:MAG: LapA family protein [Deltaproteobacteria bacterium]|jgi:uncharacterized integral membrane protein|nr:LapA family protein [Deltaproteobacteria bacterium]
MRFLKTFILLLVLVTTALFLLQNSSELAKELIFTFKVYVNDLTWTSGPIPFFFVILVAFALGCLVTALLLGIDRFKLSGRIRQSNKKIRVMEQELQSFRQMPISTELDQPKTGTTPPALL